MLGKEKMKSLFHVTVKEKPELKKVDNIDSLTVAVYHHFMDVYGSKYNKSDAKEIALCIFFDYALLYK